MKSITPTFWTVIDLAFWHLAFRGVESEQLLAETIGTSESKDILVEFDTGELAEVEIQKIGYKFPGERSACYSSDLLLRQYKRVRSRQRKKFSYKDIKDVYTSI